VVCSRLIQFRFGFILILTFKLTPHLQSMLFAAGSNDGGRAAGARGGACLARLSLRRKKPNKREDCLREKIALRFFTEFRSAGF
jgi:hypothetical protein